MKNSTLFSLLLMLACFVPQAARAEYYGIQVGGVRVTSDNCDNITGENIWSYGYSRTKEFVPEASHVSYDPSTKTLTLNYIQIERTGSGNRAILNESCDGLTIVFEDTNYLSALAASPIRLNANTTIKCASGRYGDFQKIYGGVEDAITVGNGATLLIEDISISVSTNRVESESGVFVGNTGTERLIIKDAAVWAQGMHGVKDFAMLGVQNGHLWLKGDNAAAKNLKDFSMVGKTMYLTDTFYNDGTLNFLNSSDYSVAREVTITDYVEINETNFPDDIFRSYVSEEFDKDNDGRLTYLGEANSNYFNNIIDVSNKGLTSLKGIEHFPYLETLKCANNNLTSLDVSKLPQLQDLDCHSNQLTSLNVIKEKRYRSLLKLNCSHNKLTRLDISQGIGDELDCSSNQLTYIDFSHCNDFLHKINISRNRIDAMMTETMESLPTVIKGAWNKDIEYTITVCFSTSNDNVCTGEQANIAKNKGWNVIMAGIDDEGNIICEIELGGTMVTSANADDLTVLPNVTKNCVDGYAKFDIATGTLRLNGVDIVNTNGIGINLDCWNEHRIIELGQDPVNIFSKDDGIYYYDHSSGGSLTITTKEDYWYSEKLNIVSTDGMAINIETGNLTLSGVARVVAESGAPEYGIRIANRTLYVKDDAELRIKANVDETVYPLYADNLVLENDNIIVAPAGAHFENKYLKSAEGTYIKGQEVVIGKLREYNYYVAGTRISNANQHAVLGDTTVVFQEPAFNGGAGTLVLTNANIEAGSEAGINAGKTLYIKLEGENNINSTTYGIASKYCYIQGPGSLYVNGKYGIDAHLSKLFISDDAKVTAEGSTQYAINGQETTISGENTVVRMKCGPDARGTFKASTSLTLNDGLKIDTPEGAEYVDGEIKDASGNVIKDEWVTIQYTEDYGITVAGTQVTNHNNKDVLGDGTVSYDPETLTLTLTDASIDGGDGSGIEAEQELHIKLEGSSAITCTRSLNGTSKGIWFKGKGFIEGPGSLSITAMYGIYAIGNNQPKPLQILDGAQVSAEGDLIGIMAGITTISGEETVVNAKGGDGSFGCTGLNLNDQLEITEPAGASFVLSKFAICVGRRNTIVTSWVTIQKVDRYNLYVKGTQVTSLNEEDVLGNGTVSFDPQTSTLTLMNAEITPTGAPGIQSSIPNLNVMLVGGNFINISDDKEGIVLQKSSEDEASEVVFYGGGTLNINTNGTALQTQADIAFTDGVNVSAESTAGAGIKGVETSGMLPSLTISGETTTLKAKGADEGSVVAFRALNMTDNITIVEPAGATFTENVGITDAEGNLIVGEWVTIGAFEIYELFIAGTQVTSLNQADVLGDGTVSYDAETNTLTLNGADIEAEGEGLSTQIDEVIIKLEGENSIEVPEGFGIYSDASFTITGPGSLNVTSKFEALNGSFVIEGGAKVTADSQTRSALWSFDPLAVSGSETVVMLKGAKGAVEIYGTDSEEAVLSLSDGLVLGLPEGAHCGIVDVLVEEDMWIPYGYILDANDNNITDQWVVICSQDYIDGIKDLKDSKDLNNSTYNLAGQKVGSGYKGIVVQGGRKLLKK
ncbi:MAG: leucine-rich repeat domain-containing protein [Bacteroidaceae bacterium]|nr:leucine-rich repeat domain-containing protein [Bacteroidaceae bacterium]